MVIRLGEFLNVSVFCSARPDDHHPDDELRREGVDADSQDPVRGGGLRDVGRGPPGSNSFFPGLLRSLLLVKFLA